MNNLVDFKSNAIKKLMLSLGVIIPCNCVSKYSFSKTCSDAFLDEMVR